MWRPAVSALASASRAMRSASNSRCPPPTLPRKSRAVTTIVAPASRGVEPAVCATVTITARWPCASACARSATQAVMEATPTAQFVRGPLRLRGIVRATPRDGPSALMRDSAISSTAARMRSSVAGASRRGECRYVRDARDGVAQRLECRQREHERRLADGLRAVDGLLAIGLVVEVDAKMRRNVARRRNLVRRRRVGLEFSLARSTTAPPSPASPSPG